MQGCYGAGGAAFRRRRKSRTSPERGSLAAAGLRGARARGDREEVVAPNRDNLSPNPIRLRPSARGSGILRV